MPFVSVENISDLKTNKYISEQDFERDFKTKPERGDVLMTRIGDVGTANVIRNDGPIAYYVSLALLKPQSTNSDFLKYLIGSYGTQRELWRRTLHVAFPKKINKGEIGEVPVSVPSEVEQKQIGHFFDQLDNLIAANQCANRKGGFVLFYVRPNTDNYLNYMASGDVLLTPVYWNDKGYQITYSVNILMGKMLQLMGNTRIASNQMEIRSPNTLYLQSNIKVELPNEFERLNDGYYSLGTSEDYYEEFQKLGIKVYKPILEGLKDLVIDDNLFDEVSEYNNSTILYSAVMRDASVRTLSHDYRAVLTDGKVENEPYHLSFEILKESNGTPLTFDVNPDSPVPSNLHAIIGRNGVGKSLLFSEIIKKLTGAGSMVEGGKDYFGNVEGIENISNVTFIGFSIFDSTVNNDVDADGDKLRFSYVGVKNNSDLSVSESLEKDFKDSVERIYQRKTRETMFARSLDKLDADPVFSAYSVKTRFNEFNRNNIDVFFRKLSSGHKIVLLTVARLVEIIESNTLVLFDEPELHLHPPLISALISAIQTVIFEKNSIGLIATHSPVIIQEIDKDSVWILEREKEIVTLRRSQINTYGQSFGNLTHEIFNLEIDKSGFHAIVKSKARELGDYDQLQSYFGYKLGDEAEMLGLLNIEDTE